MRNGLLLTLTLVSCLISATASARAPDTFEEDYAKPILIDSPMWFAVELKTGPYVPGTTDAAKDTFKHDKGWLLSVELDVTLWEIPKIGQLNLGGGFGWADYSGKALAVPGGGSTSEGTSLTLYPLSALAVLRVDSLARYTVVPLTFAGKLGSDFVVWKAVKGAETNAHGVNIGLRWAVQAAFELDFFEPQTARRMDEDFGINHTFLLFEYFQSVTQSTGDHTFQIGLGAQF
jgi:hypothetical protein